MSKCRRCRELFRSVLRSVQAIKLLKDSVCKMAFHKKTPEFFDSPTYQFEQDGIDSSAAPQPGATSWDYGPSFFDTMDDFFPDPEYSPPALTIESIDTGLPYPTNLEPTNLELQTELSWIHQTGEPFYDTSHNFTPHPLGGDLSLLHEQGTAMYGTDETVSALLPLPEPNYEVVALLNCNTSGSPASMLQTSTFNWSEIPVPQNYQDLTSFVCQTIDAGPPYDRHVECEQVAEGDDWYIPRVPQTQARRLGWCTIRNMVRACKIFLSRIRSRMGLQRKRKCREDDDYSGVRHRRSRPQKFGCECRLSALVHGKEAGKLWLGSFPTQQGAARAYDVGRMFCSKRATGFNFPASEGILSILRHVILNLPLEARKEAIKDVAKEYGKTGGIDGCTRKLFSQASNQFQWNYR